MIIDEDWYTAGIERDSLEGVEKVLVGKTSVDALFIM
jgi:hypothetical protein